MIIEQYENGDTFRLEDEIMARILEDYSAKKGFKTGNTFDKIKDLVKQYFIDLANILGFENRILSNESNIVGAFKNTSNNIFDLSRQNPYFIIISKNINLESYDSETGGRLNILHSFGDNSENSEGSVFFEPSNPIFLDIFNNTAKTIRNLRFEIRNADLTRINNDGLISLCILIN